MFMLSIRPDSDATQLTSERMGFVAGCLQPL